MSSLIFNHITTPVGRAGAANLILPGIAMVLFLLLKALALPLLSSLVVGGFLLCALFMAVRTYLTTLARIDFVDDRVQMWLSVYRRDIRYDSIESVEILRLRLTPLLRVRIKAKTFGHGAQFTIQGPESALGSLQECSTRLAEEFRAKGIRTIAR
jgi:hypothetical protein